MKRQVTKAMKHLMTFVLISSFSGIKGEDIEKEKQIQQINNLAFSATGEMVTDIAKFKDFKKKLESIKDYDPQTDGKALMTMASVPAQYGWPPVIERPKSKAAFMKMRISTLKKQMEFKKQVIAYLKKKNFPDNLQAAAARKDFKAVKKFVDDGADVNAPNEFTRWPALHYAALAPYDYEQCCGDANPWIGGKFIEKDQIKILNFLIQSGADVNLKTFDGYAPLGMTHPTDKKIRPILLKAGAKDEGSKVFSGTSE